MEVKILDAGIVLRESPVVRELIYDSGKLVIKVDPGVSRKMLEIIFKILAASVSLTKVICLTFGNTK